MRGRTAAAWALVLLLGGCASAGSPGAAAPAPPAPPAPPPPSTGPAPSAAPSTAATPAPAAPVWTVGASPLPLRPDGFGEVLPTPEVLRDRRLPTRDLLPPPADGRFAATVAPVSAEVRARMGGTWSPACPVALEDLRHLTLAFHGFDGRPHTGELVVAARVADDVVQVLRALFEARFPLEEMRLLTDADLQAPATGDGSNTAAYICRTARGQTRWSEHAYGTAIDINPFHNPYVKGDLVLPELASAYTDRSWARPGMHLPGGPAVQAFADIGWTWGGTWSSLRDYQHYSLGGT